MAAGEGLGEDNGLPQNPYRRRIVAAGLREAEGDLDAALVLLDEAERVYNGDYSPNVQPVPARRARLRLRRGEYSDAEDWARESGLDADDELSYLREYEHITLARLLLARQDPRAAGLLAALAGRCRERSPQRQRHRNPCPAGPSLQAEGAVPAALAALRGAVTLAEPESYVRVFADEGPPMATLLKALARQDPGSGYLRRLVAATGGAAQPTSGANSGLIEPLSERELDVLRLLATDLDGPDIARQLYVTLNTLRTHTRNIFRKLQVNNRRAAVRQAAELDLL